MRINDRKIGGPKIEVYSTLLKDYHRSSIENVIG